jgi:hypothetical protein
MSTKPEEEPSFADRFVASTYIFAKQMRLTARQAKVMEPSFAAYRQDMRQAHRFVLDDEFTKLATEISCRVPPEKLLYRLQYATLPYETTWIEFSLPVKVNAMRRIHGLGPIHEIGSKLGLLMHRISETDAVLQVICETYGNDIMVVPACFAMFWSVNEGDWSRRMGRSRHGCETFDFRRVAGFWAGRVRAEKGISEAERARRLAFCSTLMEGGPLWGYSARGGPTSVLEGPNDLFGLVVPKFLERHGTLGYSRHHDTLTQAMAMRSGERGRHMIGDLMANETTEFTGTMRWLVVVLAMLNEVPVRAGYVRPHGQIRVGLTAKRPLLDYHTVTLHLPKTEPIAFVEKRLSNAEIIHRRGHKVMQHWRTYLHDVHCAADAHDWEYDYDEGYRLCGKCMSYGRLIHEHVRGDPSLGWVHKSYVIKPSDKF